MFHCTVTYLQKILKGLQVQIIHTVDKLKQIKFKNNIVMIPILNNNVEHSSVNTLCLMYICELNSENEYLLSFSHPDTISHLELGDLETLNSINLKYVYDKKKMLQIYEFDNLQDISLMQYLRINKNINVEKYLTKAHQFIYKQFPQYVLNNQLIPILKHVEMCKVLTKKFMPIIQKHIDSQEFQFYNEQASIAFSELEEHGLYVNKDELVHNFGDNVIKHIKSDKVYTRYNFNTITGRPSNSFGGINYAALNKSDKSRECFVSRFGKYGTLLEFDYVACHLYLIADIIDYRFPNGLTGHEYMASQYFDVSNPTQEMIKKSKAITFQQMYGHVNKKYEHIEFYKQLQEFVNLIWIEHYANKEYIPVIERKIPIIDNKQKLFNYFVQNYETKRNIPLIIEINKLLRNYNSKLVLYTYDSFLIDFDVHDGKKVIQKIKSILTENDKFPVKIKHGKNYSTIK